MADRLVPIDTTKPAGGQFPGLVTAEIEALVRAATAGAVAATTVVDVFTADGVWTRRAGATLVTAHIYGAGGSGGAGAKGPAGSALVGGGGGGSGAYTVATFLPSDLTATVPVTVGKGGAAVAGQTVNSTAGANGNPGALSQFGTFAVAGRGQGGTGGGTATGGTGGSSLANGVAGASAPATGAVATAPANSMAASSGGAGGGITTAGVASAGGPGGTSLVTGKIPASGGTNAAGTAGPASTVKGPGGGGGGGAASVTGNGFAGGDAGNYGAGGGGGGAALNDKGNSGGGGKGGDGIVVVVTHIGPAVTAAVAPEAFAELTEYTLQASDREKRFEEPTRVLVPADLSVRKGKRVVLAGEYVEVVPEGGDDGGAFPAAVVHGEAVLVRVSSTEWGLTGDVEPLAAEDDVLPVPVGDPDADGLYPTSADEPVAVEVVDPEASPERE